MFNQNPLLTTDGYKTGHHLMYVPNTTMVYSNYTCRSTKRMPDEAQDVVVFGTQYVFKYIKDMWDEHFFKQDKDVVCQEAKEFLSAYLMADYNVSHFEALWDLGYLPIEVKALEEGTIVKAGVPLFVIHNTKPEFFWITNFLESSISAMAWKPVHSASLALAFKKTLLSYAKKTDSNNTWLVDFQGHDFSFRGMQSLEAAIGSAMGFSTIFSGSDTIPILKAVPYYYTNKENVFSVNATEHSVMCSGTKEGEIETFRRLMKTFPKGILSIVSDTWDLWTVLTQYIPTLKEEILARDGKVVIRPDSGDPVDIICGIESHRLTKDNKGNKYRYNGGLPDYTQPVISDAEEKGVVELLWETFGGTISKEGYKVLDSHIGAIYGDSITLERAKAICERLEAKGFASTNVVLGIGSYSMGYATRDNQGGAIKSTYVEIDGEGVEIFKDPVTDDGTKKSAKGLLRVNEDLTLTDQCTWENEGGMMKTIFKDGEFVKETTYQEIRKRIDDYLNTVV